MLSHASGTFVPILKLLQTYFNVIQAKAAYDLWKCLCLRRRNLNLLLLHCNTNSVLSTGEHSQFWSPSSNSAQLRTDPGTNPISCVDAAGRFSLGKDTTSVQGVSLQRLTLSTVPYGL